MGEVLGYSQNVRVFYPMEIFFWQNLTLNSRFLVLNLCFSSYIVHCVSVHGFEFCLIVISEYCYLRHAAEIFSLIHNAEETITRIV